MFVHLHVRYITQSLATRCRCKCRIVLISVTQCGRTLVKAIAMLRWEHGFETAFRRLPCAGHDKSFWFNFRWWKRL